MWWCKFSDDCASDDTGTDASSFDILFSKDFNGSFTASKNSDEEIVVETQSPTYTDIVDLFIECKANTAQAFDIHKKNTYVYHFNKKSELKELS